MCFPATKDKFTFPLVSALFLFVTSFASSTSLIAVVCICCCRLLLLLLYSFRVLRKITLSCGCCSCFFEKNSGVFMLFLILGKSLTVMCCSLGFLRKSCFFCCCGFGFLRRNLLLCCVSLELTEKKTLKISSGFYKTCYC